MAIELENLWKHGVYISDAWFDFCDPYAVNAWRETKSKSGREARLELMMVDLFGLLESGHLVAVGHRMAPEVSASLVAIPPSHFSQRPQLLTLVENVVESFGHRFEAVRVACNSAELTGDNIASPETLMPNSPEIAKRGGGRKSLYSMSQSILLELHKVESTHSLSAEQLHPQFKAAFDVRFPREEFKSTAPSVRSLRDHLKRFRQELAETGKN